MKAKPLPFWASPELLLFMAILELDRRMRNGGQMTVIVIEVRDDPEP